MMPQVTAFFLYIQQPTKPLLYMQNNYVNHNRRILNAVAGEAHAKWERDGNRYQLKKAKKNTAPIMGKMFSSLSALVTLI